MRGGLERWGFAGAVWLAAWGAGGCAEGDRFPERVIEYRDGMWFTGAAFEPGARYVSEGSFVDAGPQDADSVVQLDGRWIVPPFGDAHTHNLDGDTLLAEAYLREGVFYVQVLTNSTERAARVRPFYARVETPDVVYANGGVSSEYGHPVLAYEPPAAGIPWAELWQRRDELCESRLREGDAYWYVETEAELAERWPDILAGAPDVLKVYLIDTESTDPPGCDRLGGTGLDPALLPPLMERARAAGLFVWAHVETAADARLALEQGVQGLAHVPGYSYGLIPRSGTQRLAPEDLETLAEREVWLTPTVALVESYFREDPEALVAATEVVRHNLQTWMDAGGKVMVGSDVFGSTARGEVEAFLATGLWDETDLLRIWAQETPRAIFPDRSIGRLEAGFEASWLALECDPLQTFACVDQIESRMKQGSPIRLDGDPTG